MSISEHNIMQLQLHNFWKLFFTINTFGLIFFPHLNDSWRFRLTSATHGTCKLAAEETSADDGNGLHLSADLL